MGDMAGFPLDLVYENILWKNRKGNLLFYSALDTSSAFYSLSWTGSSLAHAFSSLFLKQKHRFLQTH